MSRACPGGALSLDPAFGPWRDSFPDGWMPKEKFVAGEQAEVKCFHVRDGQVVEDWLAGRVVEADYRMAAVKFDTEVYSSNGQRMPDRILWCAHGSPNIRRPGIESNSHSPTPQGE